MNVPPLPPAQSDAEFDEACELINRLLDGELSPADAARLEHLVCGREDIRKHYVLNNHLWCNLAPHFTAAPAHAGDTMRPEDVLESEASMVLPALRGDESFDDDEPEPIELPPLVWPTEANANPWRRRMYAWGALAASVLLVTSAALFWPQAEPIAETKPKRPTVPVVAAATQPQVAEAPEPPALPPLTATLASAVGAEWGGPLKSIPTGTWFRNDRLVLRKGLAELRFVNGVRLILEAPAQLQLRTDMRAELFEGKLVATVPPAASGFVVETASAAVVDLGTEFGVEVDNAGATRVEVFQGKVQANGPAPTATAATVPTTGPATAPTAPFEPRLLTAGEAGRVERGAAAVKAEAPTPLSFVREDEFAVRSAAASGSTYHRWLAYTYQLRRDPSLAAYYTFERPPVDATAPPTTVTNRAVHSTADTKPEQFDLPLGYGGDETSRPSWTLGRWPGKSALAFSSSSRTGAVLPEFPHTTNGRLTVAAWVYARRHAPWAAIAKNRGDTRNAPGQFSLGLYDREGTLVGRVAQEDGVEVLVRDPAPLPLGQWVHVALVADGKTLRVFRNGAEVASVASTGPRKTANPRALAVGYRAGPGNLATTINGGEFWDGTIDELAIFHRPLTPAELNDMYEAGRPGEAGPNGSGSGGAAPR